MRKSNTEQVGAIIAQFMRAEGIETPYNQWRVTQAWSEVMGHGIAKYTGNVFVKNQTLHVQILSPALRQNLMSEHRALARKLNEHVNAQVIENIRFY